MASALRRVGLLLLATLLATPLFAQKEQVAIPNWAAPLYWSPEQTAATPADTREDQRAGPPAIHAESVLSVPTSPLPFIGITPCRIVDTRKATQPAGYGPPPLAAEVSRDFNLIGQCGIAGDARAVSLNVTVTNTAGPGFITIYPQGEARPLASTLNYIAGQTVANAAITALGSGGGITVVAAVSGTDLVIDTNGYYAGARVGTFNTFLGTNAGNLTTTGEFNTGIGYDALAANTTGTANTANGHGALRFNVLGSNNTAIGEEALASNIDGSGNTASGLKSLGSNTSGWFNTGTGSGTLGSNTTGSYNTAVGDAALVFNTVGSNNTAVGFFAGGNVTSGSYNIWVGNAGNAGDSQTIRIGDDRFQLRIFVAGIRGAATENADAIPVLIDSLGQLGTVSSSARFKEEVEDMAEASNRLLKLRPVTFRYKGQAGARKQFGLIAEEVEKVLPELVVSDSAGEVETVLYHEMPAMLLNELQKQEKRITQQASEIEQLKAEVAALQTAVAQR